MPSWYITHTRLGTTCDHDQHCPDCQDDGLCGLCNTVDGRWADAVNLYASTCDGCGELTSHCMMFMTADQLGYCEICTDKIKEVGPIQEYEE